MLLMKPKILSNGAFTILTNVLNPLLKLAFIPSINSLAPVLISPHLMESQVAMLDIIS